MVEKPTSIMNGMASICAFLGRSEATVIKWTHEYPDMPVKKINGRWESDREALQAWRREILLGLPPTSKPAKKRAPKKRVKPINQA